MGWDVIDDGFRVIFRDIPTIVEIMKKNIGEIASKNNITIQI
jgi:predicted naringenin-chalcone synthase